MLRFSPLGAFFDGIAAVIVFFVLSGYVLALSYTGGRQTYGGFLVRRVARLWFPYAAAIGIAVGLAAIFGNVVVGPASGWFNSFWLGSVGPGVVLEHLSLVGHIGNTNQLDPVIWSLVVEMRISLIFPLLLIAPAVLGWRLTVVGGVLPVCSPERRWHKDTRRSPA